jgi:hypothetical protein
MMARRATLDDSRSRNLPKQMRIAWTPTAVEGPAYSAAYREWRDLFDHSRQQTSADVTQSYRCGSRGRSDERSYGAGE